MKPPVASKKPHVHKDHPPKFVREDPYYWMREKDSPEVLAMLKAENEYADAFMRPHSDLQEKLFQEIKGRVPQHDTSIPQVGPDGWSYYTEIKEGEQYHRYLRRWDGLVSHEFRKEGEVQVLLDLNEFGENHDFVGIGAYACPEKNPTIVWYTIDLTGFRQYQLRLRDIGRCEDVEIPELDENLIFSRVSDFCLVENHSYALWLVVEDEDTKRPCSLYFWKLGADPVAVAYASDERFCMSVSKTSDRRYVTMHLDSHTTTEAWYTPALLDSDPEMRPLIQRVRDRELQVDHHRGHWFIMANDCGRNNRIVAVQDGRADPDPWIELIPHREDTLLEEFKVMNDHLVVLERGDDGAPAVVIYDLVFKDNVSAAHQVEIANRRRVDFGEHWIECELGPNYLTGARKIRVHYQSPITPRTVVDVDLRTLVVTTLKRQVIEDYDPSQYVCERQYALADDHADIPMTIYRRKDTPLDGSAPMWMSGYGAYGLSYELDFRPEEVSLLNRGFVMAIAHVRGGSELGKKWHDNGRMEHKMNSFRDFISCGDFAVSHKYTSMEKLCVSGGSAGGLLMGAVANMAPSLFQVIVNYVPFVDVLTTMQDREIPLTVGEFEEWGNPGILEQYRWMAEYSPVDNIEAKSYPAMLVRTSYNDSQVMYWEPAKYVAKLRDLKTDDIPLLFTCDMGGGHGGSSGRFDQYKDQAFDYAFVLSVLRIDK